ncbi:hypothetical protein [Dokdonella sp.]|uniref:hypothetical protein n=1 Tax=Dokdonella sp. TaxID=2291710 RepID=UPI003C5205BE
MRHRACIVVCAGFVLALGVCTELQAGDSVPGLAQAFRDIDENFYLIEEKLPLLENQFEAVQAAVAAQSIARLSDADVLAYFETAYILAFYSNEASHAAQMQLILYELESRNLATTKLRQQMLDRYAGARMLREAQAFAAYPANAGVKALPDIRDASSADHSPTLWTIEDQGGSLVRRDVFLGQGAHVIVVGSPWCYFSKTASAAIQGDAQMSTLMERHSTWIMPQTGIPDLSEIEEWNRTYSGRPLKIVYLEKEWPMIPAWTLPGFYFFQGDKLVTAVNGWPGLEQMDVLREGFASIGIPPQDATEAHAAGLTTTAPSRP